MGVVGHLFRPTERIDGVPSQACTAHLPACLPHPVYVILMKLLQSVFAKRGCMFGLFEAVFVCF